MCVCVCVCVCDSDLWSASRAVEMSDKSIINPNHVYSQLTRNNINNVLRPKIIRVAKQIWEGQSYWPLQYEDLRNHWDRCFQAV
jgi:hypothetical protein